jgi:hypothetical protein
MGGARLTAADLRYPQASLLADYGRALTGAVLCGAPLLALDINFWLGLVLAGGLILFILFGLRTALRQHTRYVLSDETLCVDGPAGTLVEWSRIDRLKLSYFSTKRDRTDGWMQLSIGSSGSRQIRVDSSLDGFHEVVEHAARAAGAAQVEMSVATCANLRSMGIPVPGLSETGIAVSGQETAV